MWSLIVSCKIEQFENNARGIDPYLATHKQAYRKRPTRKGTYPYTYILP
jgi:hypothetical protein